MKVVKVVRLVSCFEQDGCDQEPTHEEEERDAGPSPERRRIERRAREPRMAVVENDRENGEPPQPSSSGMYFGSQVGRWGVK